uniref:ABC transporter permease subunit n=1 Tax=Thaumasiovibrio occultus TaxID=1891184 RepID=UPI000B34E523|nr:ABC transporter permease subunit [Thaumasiovibrio occultus]
MVKRASVTELHQSAVNWSDNGSIVSRFPEADIGFRVSDNGKVDFYAIKSQWELLHTIYFPDVTSVAQPRAGQQTLAFGHNDGSITVFEPDIADLQHSAQERFAEINYPLGAQKLYLDLQHQSIDFLTFALNDSQFVALGQTADARWVGVKLKGQTNPITYETEWERDRFTLDLPTNVDDVAISPDGQIIYVMDDHALAVYQSAKTGFTLRETIALDASVVSMALLPGASSVLTASESEVTQWFDVRNEDGERHLTAIRQFPLKGVGKPAFAVEEHRRSFIVVQPDGELGLFYTTSRKPLAQTQVTLPTREETSREQANHEQASAVEPHTAESNSTAPLVDPLTYSLSGFGNMLTISGHQQVITYRVSNSHPEATFSSLFEKVWYDGYPEPDFVWQSSTGGENYEPKLSLIPLIFGTLKTAVVAMLFSVPLAVGGAIYTAYFMSSRMRSIVKPTIELMEALPTVILGFLAGLWLAPIVEVRLPAMAAMIISVPLVALLVGFLWRWTPKRLGWRIPNGWHVLILVPVLVATIYSCFALNDWLEVMFFEGDARLYLSREFGLGFDQRNAVVVGIAMGFAVTPTIFTISEDAIYSVPPHLTSGSLALGATHWQTLSRVVLVTASPGIFSAIMMGIGRAIGETMIVLMATGNTPIMDMNLLQGMRTLAANIAMEMPESEVGSTHYRVLFLSALVLFIFTFVFNTLAEVVRQRLRDKYSNM